MVIKDPPSRLRLLVLLGFSSWLNSACTAQLDRLKVEEEPPSETSSDQEPDSESEGMTSNEPDSSTSAGTVGSSTSPEVTTPTCAQGLLNEDGFCVPEVRCAPGTFITRMNDTQACAPCPSGSFSVEYDARECALWRDCQLGEFVREAGTSSRDRTCEECPDGSSTTVMNAGECSSMNDCPAGTFIQDEDCIDCEAGNYCSGKTEQEVPCEEGTWDDDLDPGTPCIVNTDCTTGQFVQSDGSNTTDRTCEFCPSETFSGVANAAECQSWAVCLEGTQVDVQGTPASDRSCKDCPAGTFSDAMNAASCTSWTSCLAPSQFVESEPSTVADRVCGDCASGQSTDEDNQLECTDDPVNLVGNASFESSGTPGWIAWAGATLSVTNVKAHSGDFSLLATGPGTGPAAKVLDSVAEAGASYDVSFWVSVGKVASSHVNLTRGLGCGGAEITYLWLAEDSAVESTGWTNLTGTFDIPTDCTAPKLTVYAEGSGSNVDLYLDDVSVTRL
jgi:hypothetical protein